MDKKTWIIDEVNKDCIHNEGALHATQYFPTSVKVKTTARTNCTNFSGSDTMSNLEGKVSTIPLNTYKYNCRSHMILNIMWDAFSILDPFDTTKN